MPSENVERIRYGTLSTQIWSQRLALLHLPMARQESGVQGAMEEAMSDLEKLLDDVARGQQLAVCAAFVVVVFWLGLVRIVILLESIDKKIDKLLKQGKP